MQHKRLGESIAAGIALVILMVLSIVRSTQQSAPSFPSTYDTGVSGYAALYDLLAKEDVHVDRFERPLRELPAPAGHALVLAGTGAFARALDAPNAAPALKAWLKKGGMLVVLDDALAPGTLKAFGLPPAHKVAFAGAVRSGCAFALPVRGLPVSGTFSNAFSRACTADRRDLLDARRDAPGLLAREGRGTIAIVTSPSIFDNTHLAKRGNAQLAYALFSGVRSVQFDEYVYGYSQERTFWQVLPWPVRVAMAIALLALIAAIVGANIPIGPPPATQPAEEPERGAYIEAIARMLERGGAGRDAIARLHAYAEHVLHARAKGDDRARMLLRELRMIEQTAQPGAHEVLAAGRIFARIRKEYS